MKLKLLQFIFKYYIKIDKNIILLNFIIKNFMNW